MGGVIVSSQHVLYWLSETADLGPNDNGAREMPACQALVGLEHTYIFSTNMAAGFAGVRRHRREKRAGPCLRISTGQAGRTKSTCRHSTQEPHLMVLHVQGDNSSPWPWPQSTQPVHNQFLCHVLRNAWHHLMYHWMEWVCLRVWGGGGGGGGQLT
jgi:hypothetical protein